MTYRLPTASSTSSTPSCCLPPASRAFPASAGGHVALVPARRGAGPHAGWHPIAAPVRTRRGRRALRYHLVVQRSADEATDGVDQAFARGEDGSLEAVYRRYGDLVYTLCRRTLDESRACDVAQEVFISAWKGHERFDPAKGNLAAWLVTIAKNRIIDNIRAAKRHSDRRSGADLADMPSDAGIEQIAERLMIAEALRRLPEATRRVITMHYFDGLTHPQIAETTSLPLGTVKSTIHRGLAKIRDQLESADE
ncbi:MAG: sigma-70 family RNA polymerase sigma factor [Acidimicrobiales bacterium]|nr:sigma-70 family RNA polymerase sigma factor [Acidimicrobiales bacterium]MYI27377.1 sigma-70 family RNA polymerase sigma factor [Acidimicrobiales bacterium]